VSFSSLGEVISALATGASAGLKAGDPVIAGGSEVTELGAVERLRGSAGMDSELGGSVSVGDGDADMLL
jgi:hypothetical protein